MHESSLRMPLLWPPRVLRGAAALAGLTACATWLWLGASWRLVPYDEGLMLTGALRVMAGQEVHRDFYANYGPAEFHLLALMFQHFGLSVGLERVVDLVFRLSIVVSSYRLAQQVLGSRRQALGGAIIVTFWLSAWGAPSYPVWGCLLLLLNALACLWKGWQADDGRAAMLAAGGLTGLIFTFRYDVFVFVLAAFGLAFAWIAIDRSLRWRPLPHIARQAGWLLAGAVVVVAPVAAWLVIEGAWPALWVQVVEFPGRHYAATRALPFPSAAQPQHWVVYLPILAVVGGALLRLGAQRVDVQCRPRVGFALLLALLSGLLFLKGIVRVSALHASLAAVVALLFVAMAQGLRPALPPWHGSALLRLTLRAAAGLAAIATLVAFGQGAWQAQRNVAAMARGFAPLTPRGAPPAWRPVSEVTGQRLDRFLLMSPHAAAAAQLVRRLSAPHDRLFVGNGRHDKVVINDVSFYFLVDRLPGTRWHHFDPGLQNARPVQQALIAELQANDVRWVVLASDWDDMNEPNDSARSSGVFDLDRFLRAHYRPLQTFGSYSVWARDDVFEAQRHRLAHGE